jgi:hypothetical protein
LELLLVFLKHYSKLDFISYRFDVHNYNITVGGINDILVISILLQACKMSLWAFSSPIVQKKQWVNQ